MNNPGLVLAQAAEAAAKAATAAFAQMSQAVSSSVGKMSQAIASSVGQAGQSIQAMADRVANAGGVVGIASGRMAAGMTAASVGILAFVRAGLQGTTEGARLGFQIQLLSREVASIFLPAIDKAISLLSVVVNKFQELSGAQQQAIFQWGGLAAGVVLFVTKINPIIGLISAVTSAFSLLGDSAPGVMAAISEKVQLVAEFVANLYEKFKPLGEMVANVVVASFNELKDVFADVVASMGPLIESITDGLVGAFTALFPVFESLMGIVTKVFGFILDMIGKMISGLGWILDKVKDLLGIGPGGGGQPVEQPQQVMAAKEEVKKEKGDKHRSVTLQAGGFEGLQSTYNRIQEGIMKTFDPQAAHVEMIRKQDEQIAAVNNVVVAVKGVNVGVGN